MAKVTTTISLDADIKTLAQKLFADLGLDMSTAVNIFLRQAVYENGIPFAIVRDIPNAETIAAIRELEDMKNHPEKYKRYSSFDEIMRDIEDGKI